MSVSADTTFFDSACERIRTLEHLVPEGRVRSLVGSVLEGEGLSPCIGSLCLVQPTRGRSEFHAEVVGFREDAFLLMPLGEFEGVAAGDRILCVRRGFEVPLASACLGRVIDGLGRPLDGGPPLPASAHRLEQKSESALTRRLIDEPLDLGVRALNAFLTTARGARVGLFAGSGVGKSTLLGQIARFTEADVNVVALIGERGREVREFVERELGDALARSVVVVATSDEPALLRRRTAFLATALAEQFRNEGRDALLLMDSVTRFCTAHREIGLAAGEPPATRGHPPSLWSILPRLVERAGNRSGTGSITAIYTVLVEGDDLDEPVADALRAVLDGHVVLSREIASRGQFPAIDVLQSVSRLMPDVATPEHQEVARRARQVLATHRQNEDLLSVGAYVAGSDPAIDEATALMGPLNEFLRQSSGERMGIQDSVAALRSSLGAAVAERGTA